MVAILKGHGILESADVQACPFLNLFQPVDEGVLCICSCLDVSAMFKLFWKNLLIVDVVSSSNASGISLPKISFRKFFA